jgi:hypothetical protein
VSLWFISSGVNALVAAADMTGINGRKLYALPHDRLRQVLKITS